MRKIILFILQLCIIGVLHAQIHAVWVTPWDLDTPAKIDQVIQTCRSSNFNQILAEVRYRSDAMYMPNKSNHDYPNDEPRSYLIKDRSFDPLQYLIDRAKPYGIEVHAWLTIMAATTTRVDLMSAKHIYYQHPDWMTWDATHRMYPTDSSMGAFLDPGVPEVQDHIVNVIKDIVVNYPDLDGIHLDYIRYPARQYGNNPHALEIYYNETDYRSPERFATWKREQVSRLVKRIYYEVKMLSPQMVVSAAVIARFNEAYRDYCQDWKTWMQEGYIDYVYPMAYVASDQNFEAIVHETLSFGYPQKVVMGLRAWSDTNNYSVYRILSKLFLLNDFPFAGNCLFSYEGLKSQNYLPELVSGYYKREAKLPPKPDLQNNAIFGYVSDANEKAMPYSRIAIDDANLETFSDANGFYCFPLVPYGLYDVKAENRMQEKILKGIDINPETLLMREDFKMIPEMLEPEIHVKAPILQPQEEVQTVAPDTVKIVTVEVNPVPSAELETGLKAEDDEFDTTAQSSNFDVQIHQQGKHFDIQIHNPQKQVLTWYVINRKNRIVYYQQRSYLEGLINESWDCVGDDGFRVDYGIYKIIVNSEDSQQVHETFIYHSN